MSKSEADKALAAAEAEVKRLEAEINKPKKLDKGQTLFGL